MSFLSEFKSLFNCDCLNWSTSEPVKLVTSSDFIPYINQVQRWYEGMLLLSAKVEELSKEVDKLKKAGVSKSKTRKKGK